MSVIGLRVGPFEIVEPAQVPEPGDWYRARRTGMTRRQPAEVLVKLLAPDAEGPERAALQSEFDNLRAMEDPRVPEAVALYEGIGALAISAPDGITFDDIVAARDRGAIAMTPATLLDLALEIAETLQHAHHRNRHHGHLSGENIRLSTSGKLHIFGFASGPGTPVPLRWCAPERARGEPLTHRTDQWSLAAVLAGLITGKAPWDDEGSARNGEPDAIIEPIERQWPALARLFRRMLDPVPDNRYASMQPVRQELLALSRKAGGTSEKRDLGKLMARRVDRSVAPDSDVPAEFTTPGTDVGLDLPDDFTDATVAEPRVNTATETEYMLRPPEDTGELAEPPAIPDLDRPRREPEAIDAPPIASRMADGLDLDAPLVTEDIHAVHPDLSFDDDLPEARRDGDDDFDIPGPAADDEEWIALTPLSPSPPPPDAEDVSDAPTEKYDQARLRALADLDDLPPPKAEPVPDEEDSLPGSATPVSMERVIHPDSQWEADFESSDVGFPPDELARALAVDAAETEGPAAGVTAVPITDVSDEPSSVEAPMTRAPDLPSPTPSTAPRNTPAPMSARTPTPVSSATPTPRASSATPTPFAADPASRGTPTPVSPPTPTPARPFGTPTPTPASPFAPDFEPIEEAVRDEGFEPPAPSPIQKYAPLLVLFMVLLMLAFVGLAVW